MDSSRLLKEIFDGGSLSTAILAPGRQPLAYPRLFEHCAHTLAGLNSAGISRGDRVAVVLPNGAEMATCFLAVTMGASCAPLNPTYRRSEFEFYLSDLAPRALIVQEGVESPAVEVAEARGIRVIRLRPMIEQEAGIFALDFGTAITAGIPVFAEDGDEALVLHTSGTTARPKMVPLTNANLAASAASIAESLGLGAADRCLNVMPLFHIHGLVGALLATIASGGSIVCTPGFQAPRFLEWCREFAPTWYTAVPTMHQAVLARARHEGAQPGNLKLRLIRSCSAALAPQLMAEMEATFNVPVIEAYGMTEASHQIASNPLPPGARKPGSVGKPAGAEVALMDEAGKLLAPGEIGEIVLRGAGVTAGYAQNPEVNLGAFSNGWFRTGDQGTVDADGYVFITGRLKELINRGGQKISPREIDEVLCTHPAVAHAVAFAVPDHRLGEEIAAAVVLRPGHVASEIEIRNHAAQLIADYKVPHRVVFLDELPKGPTGKLQRIGLAALLGLGDKNDAAESASQPSDYVAPRTPTERILADIWQQVLGVERIGVADDFLALGGDSMLAALAIARIRDTCNAQLSVLEFFEYTTITGLAKLIDGAGEDRARASDPIVPVSSSGDGDLPLSSAQSRMWFLAELDENSTAYNRSNLFRIRGKLDTRALEQALEEIVARHAILRTTFRGRNGEPVQVVSPPGPVAVAHLDLRHVTATRRHMPEADRIALALAAVTEAANRKFDLTRDPMLRPLLVRLDADDHLLALTMHHIASDGWSIGVLMRELSALYAARRSKKAGAEAPVLKPPAIQYSDFAAWQSQAARGVRMRESLAWWKRKLEGAPALLALPSDRPRPPRQTFSGAAETFVIGKDLGDRLKKIARAERATLFVTLLAAFQTMLHRYTGVDDIMIGTPVAGRTRVETEGLIGLFVNTLAIRGDLAGDPTFRELLRRTREFAFEAYAHQDLPFDMVVESIHPQRNLSYPPIFQVTFQVRNYPLEDTQVAGLEVEEIDFDSGVAPFDLSFEVTEKAGRLFCKLIYNVDLFERATIARMAGHFETLIGGIVNDADAPISRLPLITDDERRQLIVDWNDPAAEYPVNKCLHELFEEQVAKNRDKVAVVYERERLTYGELNERANRLANHLIGLGVGPEVLVGICVERSLEMIVGLLAILKAGGAYVPIDPAYPKERLAFMLDDAETPILLTQHRLLGGLPGSKARTICIDSEWAEIAGESPDNPSSGVKGENLAYIIYTSGSTGVPKGVQVTHANVGRLLAATQQWFAFDGNDVWTLFHSYAFDFSVWEIWGSLLNGGRLVVVPFLTSRSPELFLQLLRNEQVTVLNQTPSAFLQLMQSERTQASDRDLALRVIIFGGEGLDFESLEPWVARHGDKTPQLVNMYGITETTVHVTYLPITSADLTRASGSRIGRPIPDLQVYILDQWRNPVPIGIAGELYVGGAGLARGYLKRIELDAEKFVPNLFSDRPGSRLYRTGDLGRYLPGGNIEYLGRVDSQVKIRGYRIELGEIESVLARHPAVEAALVVAGEDEAGDRRLVGYVVGAGGAPPSSSELRNYLKQKLPEYMVPALFMAIDAMPLTPNGKVNRAQLPAPNLMAFSEHRQFVGPRDDVERRLQTVWEEILDVRPIGVRQDFFELGGHSLNAVKALSRIEDELGFHIPLAAMFPAPTIESLAERIRGDGFHDLKNATVPIQPHGTLPPLFVVGTFQVFRDLPRQMGHDQPFVGLAIPDEMRMRMPYRLEEFAAHQVNSILRYQDAGPYFVAGFSAEGVLAFEVAQQLRAKGHTVGLLVMIDTACPTQPRERWTSRAEQSIGIFQRKLHYEGIKSTWTSLWRRVQRLAIRLRVARWQIGGQLGVEVRQPAPKRPDDFFTAMRAATRGYVPQPYDGPVLLFKRTGDLTGRYRLKDYGWGAVAGDGLEVFDVEGYHWTLLAHPGVRALAKKLEAAMRRARERESGVDSSAAAG